jgi:signal transduction histidine kinase
MFSVNSLFPILIAIHLMFGILVLILYRGGKDRSAETWAAACFTSALGLTITLMRENLPFWLGFVVANIATLYAWFLFYIALEILFSGKRRLGYWAELVAVIHGGVFALIVSSPWKSYAGVYIGVVWSSLNCFLAYRVWVLNRQNNNLFLGFFSYLYFAGSIVWFSRIFLSQIYGFNFVTDSNFSNWLTLLLNTLLVIGRQILYVFIRIKIALSENDLIFRLGQEKDRLIQSLMLTNKSAVTGALSASIAHELNQPLGASLINVQFLRMLHETGKMTPELSGQLISQLEADIKRSGTIIKSLQSLFVKNSNDYEYLAPSEVIESALAIYRSDLITKGITVENTISSHAQVHVHKGQLLQVLLNLINNAIQALTAIESSNKRITITCHDEGQSCVIVVRDNAAGIADERQAEIFELLKTNKEKGMGLGLWLCAQIIQNFGGTITCVNSSEGGAQFTLSLPMADANESSIGQQ